MEAYYYDDAKVKFDQFGNRLAIAGDSTRKRFIDPQGPRKIQVY